MIEKKTYDSSYALLNTMITVFTLRPIYIPIEKTTIFFIQYLFTPSISHQINCIKPILKLPENSY